MISGNTLKKKKEKKQFILLWERNTRHIKNMSIDFNGDDLMNPKRKSIDTASRHIFYLFPQRMSR